METRAMSKVARTAMALGLVLAYATQASAAGRGQADPRIVSTVAMRTVMAYDDGAWTSPVAVVLNSPSDWSAWNKDMVDQGMAIGEESLPAGVDWSREAVVVVALGEGRGSRVRLEQAVRLGLRTELAVNASQGGHGSYPCHVVALDRRLTRNLRLSNAAECGLPSSVSIYRQGAPAAASSTTPGDTPVAISWGEMKDAYRQ
ncbi:MAG: hypothetical protein ABI960_04010 [Candidatus Eisenbacteria bacterium]